MTVFFLNGQQVSCAAPSGEPLSKTLRETLFAREVKVGCGAGDCGSCTVLLDGAPVCACLTATAGIEGQRVETAAGLAGDPLAQKLTESFHDHQAAQCGICSPAMLLAALALLRGNPAPSLVEVQDALGGVLCRCTGYQKITAAVLAVGRGWQRPAQGGVGASIPRLDGAQKLTGAEVFGDDVAPAGALVVRIIRSPHPRAGFEFGDLEGFRASFGLTAILTAADVPGRNEFGVIPAFQDQPVFAETETRFCGEAVAAVVGDAALVAALDLSDFPVTWRKLPDLDLVTEALAPEAPKLHQKHPGNVLCRGLVTRGDAAAALARADLVVEGFFETGFVEHAYIEPEAGFAQLVAGRLEIYACTQAPGMDREALAGILALAPENIRIVPTAVGGGFGSKLDLSVQPFLALAALKTGRPVRLTYSRRESMQSTTKRHPSAVHLKIGATRDGRLCGMEFNGDFNTGAYASWGPTVATRVPIHASGPYLVPDYRASSRAVYTNNPPAGAFRGFGVPQSAVAQESLFDELADRLGLDPLEFRLKNALRDGEPTVCGQIFAAGVGITACLEVLRPAWGRLRAEVAAFNAGSRGIRRGVGIASGWYGCGNTSLPNPSTILCGVTASGQVVLHQGATDIGQGSNTVISQIFAEALGVPVATLQRIGGDTDATPDAGKTSASRQTFVTGNAAKRAGEALRAEILRRSNAGPEAVLRFEPGAVIVSEGAEKIRIDLTQLPPDPKGYVLSAEGKYDPPTKPLDANGQGAPYAQFGYAAQIAVVEVDLALGTVVPLRFVAAHDVGRAINPASVEGQVEGGIAQGLGMALMEEYLPGRTENLHDYLIPTIGDVPPIETLIVEVPDPHGPYGAKGLGEHALIPTAPAVLNAIRHATGVSVRKLPATPSRLRGLLKEAGYE